MQTFLGKAALLGVCGAMLLSATACGANSKDPSGAPGPAATGDSSLVALVPAEIRSKGVLNGGSNFAGRPLDFYSSGTKPDGAMIELLTSAADRLGLRIEWTQIPYTGLIPALKSGRIDIAGAQISPSKASAGVVNFLSFYRASSSLLVLKGKEYADTTDTCGTKLGLTSGSLLDQQTAKSINEKCAAAGKPALTLLNYASLDAGRVALRSGRIDSFLQGTPQLVFEAQKDPSLAVTLLGKLASRDTGVALPKEQLALTTAFQKALDSMIADGEYARILDKWKLSTIAISEVHVNEIPQ